MGRHRFEDNEKDQWGGPELAERNERATRHSRDNAERRPVTANGEQPQPDAGKK